MNAVKTILFVENDPVALQMYTHRLEREGFHIDSALDGAEALKKVSQLTPDMVVLDLMLPKMSGGEVLKFIRSDLRLKSLPVVIFSNAALSDVPPELVQAGPTKRLLKSDCTFPMLLQAIQDLLKDKSENKGEAVACAKARSPAEALKSEAGNGCSQFVAQALSEMSRIREHCFAYIKAPASPASLQHLPNLYQRIHFLSTNAGKSGCTSVAMLTRAFDALLSEIMVKPAWATPSVLQTIAQAVDCLGLLLKSDEAELARPTPQAKVLAVDDDAVCNHVIVSTLKRAHFDAKSVDDPVAALDLLKNDHYNLVLLDINMPGLTGFELCEKLRQIPHCKTIPVIFITGHNNFDNRKQSVLSGGHDFITKPVSASELALKAYIHLLKIAAPGSGSSAKTDVPVATAEKIAATAPPTARTQVKSVVPSTALLAGTESGTTGNPRETVSTVEPSITTQREHTVGAIAHAYKESTSQPSTLATQQETADAASQGVESGHVPVISPEDQFNRIAVIVTRIMFDDEEPSERNLRLVRIALERHKLLEVLKPKLEPTAPAAKCPA